jgi:hypothetical protein
MRFALVPAALSCLAAATPASAGAQHLTAYELLLRPVRYELDLRPDFSEGTLAGRVRLSFTNVGDAPTTEVPLVLYRLMTVTELTDGDGRPLPFAQRVTAYDDFGKLQVNFIRATLDDAIAPGDTATIALAYEGYLLGYAETGMLYVKDRIDPAFTMLRPDARAYPALGYPSMAATRAAGFAPSFHYRARITVPDTLEVAALGRLVERQVSEGQASYVYESQQLAWRMDFAIARYGVLERDGHRVFHFPEDSAGGARVMRNLSEGLDLFTRWFGPLRGDPRFTVIEIPDGWGSQTDVTGIIQAAAAFRDSTRSNEVYHEVSHLWNVTTTDGPAPRWEEGLASFLEELAVEELEGRPAVRGEATRMLASAVRFFDERPQYAGVPLVEYGQREITGLSYRVGMVFFTVLHELVGPDRFNRLVGEYYRRHAESGGSTAEFVRLAKGEAGRDLARLFDEWFYTTDWLQLARQGMTVEQFMERY